MRETNPEAAMNLMNMGKTIGKVKWKAIIEWKDDRKWH